MKDMRCIMGMLLALALGLAAGPATADAAGHSEASAHRYAAHAAHLARLHAKHLAALHSEHVAKATKAHAAHVARLHAQHLAALHSKHIAKATKARATHLASVHAKHLAALHAEHVAKATKSHAAHLASLRAMQLAALRAKHVAKASKSYAAHLARLHTQHVAAARNKHLAALHKKHGHSATVAKSSSSSPEHMRHLALIAMNKERQAARADHRAKLTELHKQHVHNRKMAALLAREAHAHAVTQNAMARANRLAALAAAKDRLAHEQALLAQTQARHRARLANLAAAHRARLAAHYARLAQMVAEQARIAAWRREQQAQIKVGAAEGVIQWGAYADSTPVQAILVDLNRPTVKVSALIARDGIGSSEAFASMIRRSHPRVAVTGTFFSLDNDKPVGDIVINGSLAYFGGMGTALAITPARHADMITVPWGRHHDWSAYDTVVACGPRLLSSGQIVLDPAAERFHDRHMLSPNSRIAVGITPGNKLIFAMTREPIYLGRMAKVMKALGCSEAMNLDAGTSTGFYCNGKMIARPGRRLTNAIVVYDHPIQSASSNIAAGPDGN